MKNKVSILIPCYNSEKTIKKCLDSISEQTYQNFKIIIVNDGSTDNTEKIISNYNDERIVLKNQENLGLSVTRNVLLDLVDTPYFFFVDSDDYIDKNLIQKNIDEINKNNELDLIFFYAYNVVNNKNKKWFVMKPKKKIITKEQYLKSNIVFAWNIFYRTSFVKNNKLSFNDKYRFFEDAGSLNYWFLLTEKIAIINERLYYYINDGSSLSRDKKMPYEKVNFAYKQIRDLLNKIDKLRENKKYDGYLKNQILFYFSVLHSYIWFSSKMTKDEKRNLKIKFKKLIKRVPGFPSNWWMFFYYLIVKIIRF
ncbi:MAG: glycosyltransferase family 2 protein [Metamycoplasmataceae bacterium]